MLELTIYSKLVKLELVNPLGNGEWVIDVRYKQGANWVYVCAPSFWTQDLTTKATTDAVFSKALAEINTELKKALGSNTTEPEKGLERIKWLMQNLKVENDKLL